MQQTKATREEILAMTMEQFEQALPPWKNRDNHLQVTGLVTLCGFGGHKCPYLERGGLPNNEKEFASKMLLRKTLVGEVLDGWMNTAQCHQDLDRDQVRSMREFLNTLCVLGFPHDVDDDNSEYNKILDSFDAAQHVI